MAEADQVANGFTVPLNIVGRNEIRLEALRVAEHIVARNDGSDALVEEQFNQIREVGSREDYPSNNIMALYVSSSADATLSMECSANNSRTYTGCPIHARRTRPLLQAKFGNERCRTSPDCLTGRPKPSLYLFRKGRCPALRSLLEQSLAVQGRHDCFHS